MCSREETIPVHVKIPADLSHTGEAYWRDVQIDACIADLVGSLQQHGIDMRGSCCGHNKTFGYIQLQDGRVLAITDFSFFYPWKWAIKTLTRAAKFQLLCLRGRWDDIFSR